MIDWRRCHVRCGGRTVEDARAWSSAAFLYQYDCWSALKYVNGTQQATQMDPQLGSQSSSKKNIVWTEQMDICLIETLRENRYTKGKSPIEVSHIMLIKQHVQSYMLNVE
ncbi:uncharacterized protein A4U43_C04F4650 [Asparagus officinalis]|uniref:Uncharacterized protein n=1 Tax=Asparagus officinalis TaxID=4686 RepID=A0A5P1F033_ASPOF|nr:uncharacterized protein A4U43_C04F4650 [Asparagus officinalis]